MRLRLCAPRRGPRWGARSAQTAILPPYTEQGARRGESSETAREQIAALVHARAEDVIFTGGGTEANALALWGAVEGAASAEARITRLFVSAIEHDSALANATAIAERVPGVRLAIVPVTKDGVVDLGELRVLLREGKGRALVAIMLANNETGAIQPLAEVAKLAKDAGALLFVDAIQAAGKIEIDFPALGADYLSLAAHKLGGPQGAGALIVREGAPFAAQILGGGQERGKRAGTENVIGIAGFGAAAAAARRDLGQSFRIAALRDRFEGALLHLSPDAVVFGDAAPRQHVEFRAAGHCRRNGRHGARSRRRDGEFGRGVLVGQGQAVACAEGDERVRRSRALGVAHQLRLELHGRRRRCGARVAGKAGRARAFARGGVR